MPVLLQLNATANWGSTGKIVEAIGVAAANRGWNSYAAYGRHANPSSLELIKVGGPLNPYMHYLENRIFDREGLGSRSATAGLIRKMEKLSPDVVHLHNIHDHWLNYRLLFEYLDRTDIRVFWTFHDCWAFTGHCFHFVTKGCNRWKSRCMSCPLKGEYPKTMIDNSSANYLLKKRLFASCRNLTVVACSEWMASLVKESFLRDKRIEVVHNGVDISQFVPLDVARTDDRFRILAVSNVWNKEKGLDDLIRLRKLLPEEYLITIVGLSSAQVARLPDGIKGLERTSSTAELVWLYNESDVLVNTSYADTFPTVNLEALACGTPVVTYETGGSPESVDRHTGVVVPGGDIVALADALKTLRNNPLSSYACRRRAVGKFDRDRCFSKYIDLYE